MERIEEIYILAYGFEGWNDNDERVGVFTSKEALVDGYYKMIHLKANDLLKNGYTFIDMLKIYSFKVINDVFNESQWSNEYRIKPETLGLPVVKEETTLEDLQEMLAQRKDRII